MSVSLMALLAREGQTHAVTNTSKFILNQVLMDVVWFHQELLLVNTAEKQLNFGGGDKSLQFEILVLKKLVSNVSFNVC